MDDNIQKFNVGIRKICGIIDNVYNTKESMALLNRVSFLITHNPTNLYNKASGNMVALTNNGIGLTGQDILRIMEIPESYSTIVGTYIDGLDPDNTVKIRNLIQEISSCVVKV